MNSMERLAASAESLCSIARRIYLDSSIASLESGDRNRLLNLWDEQVTGRSYGLVPKKHRTMYEEMLITIQPEEFDVRLRQATRLYLGGDDAALRSLTIGSERIAVEVGASQYENKIYGEIAFRSRKFDRPLFVSPSGLLHAYPEEDDHAFIHVAQASIIYPRYVEASQGVKFHNLAKVKKLRGYERWVSEVKPFGADYASAKRALPNAYEIYKAGGWEALRRVYSKENSYLLLRKFRDAGFKIHAVDEDRSLNKSASPNSWSVVTVYMQG